MKHKFLLYALAIGAFSLALNSCTEELNIKDMDTKVDVDMKLAAPVADVTLTLSDFLKMGNIGNFIQVDSANDNVLFFKDTFNIRRSYHHIDLTNYVGKRSAHFKVASQIPSECIAAGYIPGDGATTQTFNFDINLKFDGINKVFDNERLDSIQVSKARFISIINKSDLGLDWDEIKEIRVTLDSKAFSRKAGNSFSIATDGKDFGHELPIVIEDFSMNLVKDRSLPASNSNVLDSAKLSLAITCIPRNGHNVTVSSTSAIDYTLRLELMEYDAVFGRFEPGEQMHDENIIDIAKEWPSWNDIKSLNIKLAEPKIDLYIKHRLGVPLQFYGEYLYAEAKATGEKKYASFYGKQDRSETLPDFVRHNAPLNDSVITRNPIAFDNTDAHGRIDEIFAIRPDLIGYKFAILPDWTSLQAQGFTNARLTNDTIIDMHAVTTIPFVFNPGVDLSYTDTIKDVKIDRFSLDSIKASLDSIAIIDTVETAGLKLVIMGENYIPFDIEANFEFLDKNFQKVNLVVVDSLQLPHFDGVNNMHFDGPKKDDPDAIKYGDVVKPQTTINILSLDDENFRKLSYVKHIRVTAALGNNTVKVRLKSDNKLKIKLGVAFDINGALNVDISKLFENDKSTKKGE